MYTLIIDIYETDKLDRLALFFHAFNEQAIWMRRQFQ